LTHKDKEDPKDPVKRTAKEEWKDFKKNPTNFLTHNRLAIIGESIFICKMLGVVIGVEFF